MIKMYWRGFPTRVIGHPDSSVGSVHVAFWPSMKRNTAGRVLKQQASHRPKPKGKGVWSSWLKVWRVGQQHWCCLDLVRSADSQAHTSYLRYLLLNKNPKVFGGIQKFEKCCSQDYVLPPGLATCSP